ncbi:MAG: HAD hydrolase family protein [Candidatus Gribaldobacteria bacterium]|nr:HAD hydrolase family protein [Candidatus Gribaldobacteria bacterium]
MDSKLINDFLGTLSKGKNIVLSIDLDNTLVNRKKGDNYIPEETVEIIKLLRQEPGIYLIPNTGRDIIGFGSFVKENIDFSDAVLGSGSLIKIASWVIAELTREPLLIVPL